jgi:hypothetical protein
LQCTSPHNILVHKDSPDHSNFNVEGSAIISSNVLLSTACVGVKSNYGAIVIVKALLDFASQLSFITSSLVKKFGLKTISCQLPIVGIGNSNASPVNSTCNIALRSQVSDCTLNLNCAVVNNITTQLPAQKIDCSFWNIPKDIVLSDSTFNQPSTIEVLLVADVYYEIVSSDTMYNKGYPTLLDTKFGWFLSGTLPKYCINNNAKPRHINFVKLDCLETKLQKFWELEELHQTVLTPEERACEEHFVNNVQTDSSGKFIVVLPILPEVGPVAESRHNALRRFKHIENKFMRNPNLKEQYVDFMCEYEKLGHMEIVPTENSEALNFYFPHHRVII